MRNEQCVVCGRFLRINNLRSHMWVKHYEIMDYHLSLIAISNKFFIDTDKIVDMLIKEKLFKEASLFETKV